MSREPFSTIVICKNYQRVLGEAPPLERSKNLPYTFISALKHTHIISASGRDARAGALIQSQVSSCGRLRNIVARGGRHVGNVERPVDCVVRNLEKEWFSRMAIDEAYSTMRDLVGEVAGNFD